MGITQREFARRMGVTPQAVNKRVRAGRLSLLPDGTLDPDEAEREWNARKMPAEPVASSGSGSAQAPATGGTQATGGGTYAQAKTADALYKARLRQLEYEERAGAYLKTEDVKRRWYELAYATRQRLMSIPDRLAPELAAVSDLHHIRMRLDEELRTALRELADDTRNTAS